MAAITNWPGIQHSGTEGAFPVLWTGIETIDGDAGWFREVPTGSIYGHKDTTNDFVVWWEKRKNDVRDDDWGYLGGVHVISERVLYSDFTDGLATSGTYTLKQGIPVGAVVLKTLVTNVTGFTGDVSAALIVGDGTTTDRYNTGTPSVFTTDTSVDVGAVSGTAYHDAAKSIILTVTSNSDFTLVTAGALTIKVFVQF